MRHAADASSHFAVVPVEVYRDAELAPNAVRLYSEISNLTRNAGGYAYPTNEYLAAITELGDSTVRRLIGQLHARGHIYAQQPDDGGRRRIYLRAQALDLGLLDPDPDYHQRGVLKNEQGGAQNRAGGVLKNEHHKSTSKEYKSKTSVSKGADAGESEVPEGVTPELWADWLQHRREIGKPMKDTTVEYQRRAIQKMIKQRKNPDDAIRHSIANGYQGLFHPGKGSTKTTLRDTATNEDRYGGLE